MNPAYIGAKPRKSANARIVVAARLVNRQVGFTSLSRFLHTSASAVVPRLVLVALGAGVGTAVSPAQADDGLRAAGPAVQLAQQRSGQPSVTALPKLRDRSLGHFGGDDTAKARARRLTARPVTDPTQAEGDRSRSADKAVRRSLGADTAPPKETATTRTGAATGKSAIVIPSSPVEDRRTATDRRKAGASAEAARRAALRKSRPQLASRAASPDIRALRRRIVAVATREWRFFGGAEWRLKLPSIGRAGLETQPGYRERVIHFWKRGLGRTIRNTRIGWSGAFISFVMREAGAGKRFPYGGSHTWYMSRAIKARLSNDRRATFVGYRLSEAAPQPGDMVCNTLTSGITYDTVTSRRFGAHCDIVVEKGRGFIKVIGGNLTNSVRKRTLLTDARGRLYAKQPRRIDPFVKRWLVVIRARRT